mmetsp:Transcript_7011/g.16906  ORF Transcript_7011/g.16906 Transcript_7011/m.16906 type:complete len:204 (-) Transcript_7011:443-1054(-)
MARTRGAARRWRSSFSAFRTPIWTSLRPRCRFRSRGTTGSRSSRTGSVSSSRARRQSDSRGRCTRSTLPGRDAPARATTRCPSSCCGGTCTCTASTRSSTLSTLSRATASRAPASPGACSSARWAGRRQSAPRGSARAARTAPTCASRNASLRNWMCARRGRTAVGGSMRRRTSPRGIWRPSIWGRCVTARPTSAAGDSTRRR